MKLIVFCLGVFVAQGLQAQVVLSANDPAIRYDLIQPSHTFAKVSYYDSTGKKTLEFVNENVILRDSATQRLTFYRFRQVPLGRTSNDTSVIGPQPLRYHFLSAPLTYELEVQFSPAGAQVRSLSKGVHKNEFYPMKEGYFDDNIVQDISGYLPLQKGQRYTLRSFRFESQSTRGVNTYQIEYLGDDYLTGPASLVVPCRVLSYETSFEKGWLWVSQQSRELMKMVLKIGSTTVVLVKV
jgi:hypothetical protein